MTMNSTSLAKVYMLEYLLIGKYNHHLPSILPLILSRGEISPWVIGVSGSVFRKYKTWVQARDIYNARLAAGTVEVLD